MARKDKKNRTCESCGKTVASPQKLRQHYRSAKNNCNPTNVCQPALTIEVQTPKPTPESEVIQTPVHEPESQKKAPIHGEDYITEEEAKNWISPNARKPSEHYRTWGARLVQRWKELDLGDHDTPTNLDECKTLCHDLEQQDPDAVRLPTLKELEKYKKITEDPEAGPGPDTQAHRDEQRNLRVQTFDNPFEQAIIQWKHPTRINIEQFKTVFVDPSGRNFITNEEAEKWDQEQHDPDEARLPTLDEIKEKEEKNRLEYIENLPPKERQEYEIQKEYASGKHFRSIYEEPEGIYIEEEPPHGDIVFLERERDPDRQHSSLKCMTVWEGVIPSCKNPAYAFNKEQDSELEYADAPYMPQLIAEARGAITDVLKEELSKRDQIKSALVVHATYVSYTYKGTGDISNRANYIPKYHHPYHRSQQREILSEQYIDEHITKSGVEIDKKIEKYLKEESGKILLRLEMSG
ncbi:hypothetical protein GLOIN_2v1477922 [Rhizophagus clarus]|uniref:C2H2-type domain-containing protein n=1 Tax=Rhizophagus clarus TaxID=94130 RepID=A0A8H3QPC4_9GLOM|nr:hypothetical protein GLOIN_2v1477922 [Rhizophagus clarus]